MYLQIYWHVSSTFHFNCTGSITLVHRYTMWGKMLTVSEEKDDRCFLTIISSCCAEESFNLYFISDATLIEILSVNF